MQMTNIYRYRARQRVCVDIGYWKEFAIIRRNETEVERAIVELVGGNHELLWFGVCFRF